jgi:histidyl-tRNA synthetase
VFELGARSVGLRALAGGGRYDNLTELLDGPRVSGVGFGMGDAPMFELLRELGKVPELTACLDVFVIDAGAKFFPKVLEVAARLRQTGVSCDFSYKRQNVGKQFKQAGNRGARYAIVIGQEYADRGVLTLKDLATGEQYTKSAAEVLQDPAAALPSP